MDARCRGVCVGLSQRRQAGAVQPRALSDPVRDRLEGPWRGVGGDYTIVIGPHSCAKRGHTAGLPMLRTGVASFTRLWFGVRSPSTIAVSDDIDAPPEPLAALDEALLLPKPVAGWSF